MSDKPFLTVVGCSQTQSFDSEIKRDLIQFGSSLRALPDFGGIECDHIWKLIVSIANSENVSRENRLEACAILLDRSTAVQVAITTMRKLCDNDCEFDSLLIESSRQILDQERASG